MGRLYSSYYHTDEPHVDGELLHGRCTSYYDRDKAPLSVYEVAFYSMGKRDGASTVYLTNGCPWIQAMYSDDRINGEYRVFGPIGEITTHIWYDMGDEVLNFKRGDTYPTEEDDRLMFLLLNNGHFFP